jgi:Lrp/AsnC family leucine-responsive transcriptional regulator
LDVGKIFKNDGFMRLDEKDMELLDELQKDCKQSLKKIARKLNMSITTVYDRMKKLEKESVIKGYKAIINPEKTDNTMTAFIFAKIEYFNPDSDEPLSQREIAKKISMLPGVSDVYIVPGDWDLLIKVRGRSMKDLADFVIDRLRKIKGVGRTFTTDVWITVKESTELNLKKSM